MAVTTNFGIPTASGTATLMPKLQYRFRVVFNNMGGESNTNTDTTTQNVISVGRPSLTHEEVIVDSYNSKTYIAGKHTWEPITLVMRDDMNSNVVKLIGNQLQQQLDHDSQGAQTHTTAEMAGDPYKFSMKIETLDGASTPKVLDTWQVVGCYLSNVQYGDLNYGTSDMVQVTATIRYDNASNAVAFGITDNDTLSVDGRQF
jgi:hypothetical protein